MSNQKNNGQQDRFMNFMDMKPSLAPVQDEDNGLRVLLFELQQMGYSTSEIWRELRDRDVPNEEIKELLIDDNPDHTKKVYDNRIDELVGKKNKRTSKKKTTVKSSQSTSTGQSIALNTVEPRPIQWLHPGRVPKGKITIFAGDPDVGKTFLTLDYAARVSTGNHWPDGSDNQEGNVLILSAEDDLADTIVPRLQDAGANLDRIFALQSVTRYNPRTDEAIETIPTLTTDIEALRKEIQIREPSLLIIDPINAYLPGIDTHRDAELRSKVFAPLKRVAEEFNLACVCVMHLNKSNSQSAKHRVSGSIAYVASSRATWLITSDKDDPARKLMIPVKFNIGPKPDGMAYKIIQDESGNPVVAWEKDPVDVDADEALRPDGSTAPERSEAEQFLLGILQDGAVPSKQIFAEAGQQKISDSTLKRAKNKLRIQADRVGKEGEQGGGKWYWKLPSS